jgi:hypothetical protein
MHWNKRNPRHNTTQYFITPHLGWDGKKAGSEILDFRQESIMEQEKIEKLGKVHLDICLLFSSRPDGLKNLSDNRRKLTSKNKYKKTKPLIQK